MPLVCSRTSDGDSDDQGRDEWEERLPRELLNMCDGWIANGCRSSRHFDYRARALPS